MYESDPFLTPLDERALEEARNRAAVETGVLPKGEVDQTARSESSTATAPSAREPDSPQPNHDAALTAFLAGTTTWASALPEFRLEKP